MSHQRANWVILPAAGIGARMQADRPKQYLEMTVAGQSKTVIEYTLDNLLAYSGIEKIVLVVSKDDAYWAQISAARGYSEHNKIVVVEGGSERCYSVLNGLLAIQQQLNSNNNELETIAKEVWVAVHDVARPCISHADLDSLFQETENYTDGAILATPVRDTMKRGSALTKDKIGSSTIEHTVDRNQLWHALTPQLFPLLPLLHNLQDALNAGVEVTDEASAMEYGGAKPLLVNGRSDNLKITRPEDLVLAEFYLNNRL